MTTNEAKIQALEQLVAKMRRVNDAQREALAFANKEIERLTAKVTELEIQKAKCLKVLKKIGVAKAA